MSCYEMKFIFERNSLGMRFYLFFQMVTMRQQRNRTPVAPNRGMEDVRDSEDRPYSHINSSSIRNGEQEMESAIPERRLDQMERVIKNLLTFTTRRESVKHTDNVLE